MKFEQLDPREIIPIEAPHRKRTVDSLVEAHENPNLDVDSSVPFALVHYVRKGNKGIYVIDGHHRIGVAHMFNRPANVLFINTLKDGRDFYVLRDLGAIPYFKTDHDVDIDLDKKIPSMAKELPQVREMMALPLGVKNFDDFVEAIRGDNYSNGSLPNYDWMNHLGPRRERWI